MAKYKFFVIMVLVVMFLPMQDANAYINPGTGSHFFQIIASFFAGIGFFFKRLFVPKK